MRGSVVTLSTLCVYTYSLPPALLHPASPEVHFRQLPQPGPAGSVARQLGHHVEGDPLCCHPVCVSRVVQVSASAVGNITWVRGEGSLSLLRREGERQEIDVDGGSRREGGREGGREIEVEGGKGREGGRGREGEMRKKFTLLVMLHPQAPPTCSQVFGWLSGRNHGNTMYLPPGLGQGPDVGHCWKQVQPLTSDP